MDRDVTATLRGTEAISELTESGTGIGVIILAAGGSTRMGTPKQLLTFEGQTLLRRIVVTALVTSCEHVYVVIGANEAEMREELKDLPVRYIMNERWPDGMASSIVCGLSALLQDAPDTSAALLTLCDQPGMTSFDLEHLIRVYRAESPGIVASAYPDGAGVPALFDRALFPELLELQGAQGAKRVIARHPHRTVNVPALYDIDTPEEYERLLETFRNL